ncbi:MAG: CPBP family intramembrane metalloprotease [Bacteroidetes bacterium]|nr:CPBP family intramembrane metalloprotease [Bacteroidota bacterium]
MNNDFERPYVLEPVQEFDGSWERAHRSSTAAACVGLLIVGVLYIYAQGFLTAAFGFINGLGGVRAAEGVSFLERLARYVETLKNPIRLSVFISQFVFMLLPTLWIVKRWHTKKVFNYVRVSGVSFLEIIIAVITIVCFIPVSGEISSFLARQLNIPDFLSRINAQVFTSYSIEELLWLVVVVCITPALCEEAFFRGYFQRTLERTAGIKSIFIAGIVFGLFHMQPLNLISLSLLGCIFGYFFYRSKSLVPVIAAHFINNFIAVLSLYKTKEDELVLDVFEYEITFFGLAAALIFTSGLLFLYYQITEKNFQYT